MKNADTDEQDIARLLRAAGPRKELPEKLKQSWENQFRNEIQPIIQRKKHRVRIALGACATVAVLVITALLFPTGTTPPRLAIQVVNTVGSSQVQLDEQRPTQLSKGQMLSVGSSITIGPGAYAAIDYGGYDLRLNSNTTVRLLHDGLALTAGELYVSNETQTNQVHSMTVHTDLGTISDIGTQFTVTKDNNGLRANVRRGVILFETETGKYRAEATAENSAQITLDKHAKVAIQTVAHDGQEWDWIYHSGPAFTLEGHSVYEFLLWSTREAGLDVDYTTESAEIVARTTILHGETGDLNPRQAIPVVLATTRLQSEYLSGRHLRVSLLARD